MWSAPGHLPGGGDAGQAEPPWEGCRPLSRLEVVPSEGQRRAVIGLPLGLGAAGRAERGREGDYGSGHSLIITLSPGAGSRTQWTQAEACEGKCRGGRTPKCNVL